MILTYILVPALDDMGDCNPMKCMHDNKSWNLEPLPLIMTVFFMSIGLHNLVLPIATNCLDQIKFVVNHPDRFHDWHYAFLIPTARL
jgi:hypothetical protein